MRWYRRFRPRLWPTVFTVPSLVILIGLGTWQLDRLAWKTELIATIEARTSAPAVAMPVQIDDPSAWNYRRVHVSGRFHSDATLRLVNRVYDGQVGDQIVAAFERNDQDGAGQTVLVDLGWVPQGWDGGTTPEVTQITGLLRAPVPVGWFQPDNDPLTNSWFTIDLDQMADALDVSDPFPMVLYQDVIPGNPVPIGGQLRVSIVNDHLSYALTWYGLAAVLLVIYLIFHLRRREDTT